RRCGPNHRRQHQRGRDERYIHGNEINRLADIAGREIAGVSFLQKPNARIISQPEIHLTIAGVDGNYSGGAVLQHAVAEASSGSADIETNFAMEIDVPVLESLLQLEPATADVAKILAQQAQGRARVNRCARFLDL